ncbi:hypothetical protein [Archaeoglobus sp.]
MILIYNSKDEHKALDLQYACLISITPKFIFVEFQGFFSNIKLDEELTENEREELFRYLIMNKNLSGIARLDDLISAVKRKYEVLQKIREAEGNGHQSQEIQR